MRTVPASSRLLSWQSDAGDAIMRRELGGGDVVIVVEVRTSFVLPIFDTGVGVGQGNSTGSTGCVI
jgi:hypothetical protein